MPRIEQSPRAKADVLVAAGYIAKQSASRTVANRWIDDIDETLKFLANHPHSGEQRSDLGANVRAFSVGSYVIFFRPLDDGIQTVRVLHGARNITRIFRTGEN